MTLKNNGLKGRVAIIASHRSGKCIPSELAQILVAEGAIVYAVDTHQRIVDIVAKESEAEFGTPVNTKVLDFFDAEQVEGFIQEVKKREGRVDILATDLGLLEFMDHLKPFFEQERTEWRTQYRNIFEVTLLWTRAVVPVMMENNFGRIIHMVSDSGRIGVPRMSIYGAFKAAVSSFSRSLAQELARYKITCNCVSLGIQEIDELKRSSKEAITKLDKTLKLVPLRRYSEPEELALMIAYLASDLGSYITGQTISVSGGLVMT
ncbi:MAG: SDR family oxidoreductase [Deltaproteobacteria bacterium]|nr:SDR family oxidoreductase [Deltaproteobacteria bacterium]